MSDDDVFWCVIGLVAFLWIIDLYILIFGDKNEIAEACNNYEDNHD